MFNEAQESNIILQGVLLTGIKDIKFDSSVNECADHGNVHAHPAPVYITQSLPVNGTASSQYTRRTHSLFSNKIDEMIGRVSRPVI